MLVRQVPAAVGSYSQQQYEPPSYQDTAHPHFVFGDSHRGRQNARTCRQQDVQRHKFGHSPKRGVRRRQGVVGLPQLGWNPGKYMSAKGRSHHRGNDGKVQEHDDGLTTSVVAKAFLASEPSASEQSHAHDDFQEQNHVRNKRCRRSKESLSQTSLPKRTATLVGTYQSFRTCSLLLYRALGCLVFKQ